MKLKNYVAALTGALFIASPLTAQGQPVQWRYSFENGVATATYPGTVKTQGDTISEHGNPDMEGGLIGAEDTISLASQIDYYNLTGTRAKAAIGRAIVVTDNQVGPESGPFTPTPQSASYGLSIINSRPNWNTSNITGEINGASIFLRQANSDVAGILSNIGVRSGFAATLESYTFAADATGAPVKGVRTQLGVANPRDNVYYGLALGAENGANLNAGLYVYSVNPSSSWQNYIQAVDPSGQNVLLVRGSDGAMFTKTVAPFTAFSGDLGTSGLEFNVAFLRGAKITPLSYANLQTFFTCNAQNLGLIMRVNDAATAITTFNQIVNAGGGSASALVTCDGSNWRALSS